MHCILLRRECNLTKYSSSVVANIPETEEEASFNAISELEDIGAEQFFAMAAQTGAATSGEAPAVGAAEA